MEVRGKIIKGLGLRIVWYVAVLSLCACNGPKKSNMTFPEIYSSEHILMALTPEFSLQTTGTELQKQYLQLPRGKRFPMTGILRVDGKSYRFMGNDSLRVLPFVPLSTDSCGWNAKYVYLYPGAGWEQKEYNDSLWWNALGAIGSETFRYPVHSIWEMNNIYVRRHFFINDPDTLKERKLYLRYIADDQMKLYCNGEYLLQVNHFMTQIKCRQFTDKERSRLCEGDNVIAAYGCNDEGSALLDVGLYMEDKTYNEVDTAFFKRMDVQTTQTHYTFQCGDVELCLDFVSPALLKGQVTEGAPIGFITYQVSVKEGEKHDIEILFDVDMEWMFGQSEVRDSLEQDWRIIKSSGLYLGAKKERTESSFDNGHVVLSQKLCGEYPDNGVLLLGYEENRALQYKGNDLNPYWNKSGSSSVEELLKSVGDRYRTLQEECDKIDYQCNMKAFQAAGGRKYVEEVISLYRRFMSTHRLVMTEDKKLFCLGDTLGNVRRTYNDFPILLFFNRIEWMKGLLDPIFEYCENGNWVKKFPPYDIGLFPMINRQAKIDDCSVEVAADMLMMVAAIIDAEGNSEYADLHWKVLTQWAAYLNDSMMKESVSSNELLNGNDERVKRVLGWMAYQKLIRLREAQMQ